MNFEDPDALELHPEGMEENSTRENGTPTQMIEREVIGNGQQEVMTINVTNNSHHQQQQVAPQIAPKMTQMAPRPMYGQQFGQPFFQNHHFMGTPPVIMNPQETNNMNLHNMNLQAFKQTLDRQNGTINALEEVFLKIQREVNKLVAVPSTPIEWKRGHVFIDRLHNQWTCRSDTVVFENHKTKSNLISVDTVTNSNQKKIRSWVTSDADSLRGMNLIFTAKINQDHNFTTASNINLISHRCDNNLKRAVRANLLQQRRSLGGDERILVINDYNLDELNTSSLNVMKIITVPMDSNGHLIRLRIL